MKTIELPDEIYDFLKDCQNELKTQDNRCTRNPIYTVWEKKKIWGLSSDYADEYELIWDDSTYTREGIIIFLHENGYDEELIKIYELIYDTKLDNELLTDEQFKKVEDYFKDNMNSEYEIESLLQDNVCEDIYVVYYREEDVQAVNGGCFSFFEKDAYDHIKANGHNLGSKVHTYADSLFRAPRMEKLLEVLTQIRFEGITNE